MTQKFHDLVAGARSYRRFDQSKKMTMQELEELAELGRITPCGGNRQYIRFALCADEKMNAEIYKNLAWAGYLSDWDGPVEGERPTGYILILRDLSLQKNQTVDEGIVAQTIFLGARDIVGGVNWVQTVKEDPNVAKLVEKGKKQFAGTEIMGKKIGVIGLGAIGVLVANACVALGMEVYGYDPFISVDAAWNLSKDIKHIANVEDIYANCDYITVHVPLMDSTKKMINADAFAKMKDGVIVLNFARDLLVDDDALEAAIAAGKVRKYITDFPNAKTAQMNGVVAIPHLGASTEESEDNCAVMAVKELRDYLENGNITHSVNNPA